MTNSLISNVRRGDVNQNNHQTFLFDSELVTKPSDKILSNSNGKEFKMATVNGPKGQVATRVPLASGKFSLGDKVTVSATLDTDNNVTWYSVIRLAGANGADTELHDFDSMIVDQSEVSEVIKADVVEEVS